MKCAYLLVWVGELAKITLAVSGHSRLLVQKTSITYPAAQPQARRRLAENAILNGQATHELAPEM